MSNVGKFAAELTIDVRTIRQVQSQLARLKPALQRKAIRPAAAAAAAIVAKEARRNAPTGKGPATWKDGSDRKRLKRTIGIRLKTYGNGVIVAIIGPRSNQAPHGHLVEDGTKPHIIPGPVKLHGRLYQNIRHPGAAPRLFLSRALKTTVSQQRAVFMSKLAITVEKIAKSARA